MIHSRKNTPTEVFEFAHRLRSENTKIPLISVPTSYNKTTEEELSKHGFNVVIYANQMLRASYPAMRLVAEKILAEGRSSGVDQNIISIKEILNLIPGTK